MVTLDAINSFHSTILSLIKTSPIAIKPPGYLRNIVANFFIDKDEGGNYERVPDGDGQGSVLGPVL